MRVTKIIKLILIVLLALINTTHSEITFKDFLEFIETLGSEGNYDTNPKMIAFFKIIPRKKKSERRKLDFMANVLKNFLSTLNIRSEVSNIENRHFIAVINKGDKIDKQLILSQFKDLISDVNVLPPDAFRKKDDQQSPKVDF